MGKYDRGMKSLVDVAPQDFVDWLFKGARFLEWYASEFVGKECISDKSLLIEYEGKQYLLHIEFQKGADDGMAERMWQYNAQATWKCGRPVYSVVIYLTELNLKKLARSPFVQRLHHGEVVHRFRFQVITLWVVDHLSFLLALLSTTDEQEARQLLLNTGKS